MLPSRPHFKKDMGESSWTKLLPNELKFKILSNLSVEDLKNCFKTCHNLKKLISNYLKTIGKFSPSFLLRFKGDRSETSVAIKVIYSQS